LKASESGSWFCRRDGENGGVKNRQFQSWHGLRAEMKRADVNMKYYSIEASG